MQDEKNMFYRKIKKQTKYVLNNYVYDRFL